MPSSVVLCGLDILIHTLFKPLFYGCSRSSLHSEDVTLWGKGATDLLLPDLHYPTSDLGALPLFSSALRPIGHTCGLCWMSRQTIAPASSLQMRVKSQDYNCSCKSLPDTQGGGGKREKWGEAAGRQFHLKTLMRGRVVWRWNQLPPLSLEGRLSIRGVARQCIFGEILPRWEDGILRLEWSWVE